MRHIHQPNISEVKEYGECMAIAQVFGKTGSRKRKTNHKKNKYQVSHNQTIIVRAQKFKHFKMARPHHTDIKKTKHECKKMND